MKILAKFILYGFENNNEVIEMKYENFPRKCYIKLVVLNEKVKNVDFNMTTNFSMTIKKLLLIKNP